MLTKKRSTASIRTENRQDDANQTGKCPHTLKQNVGPCSQCTDVTVHRVALTLSGATIDGVAARPVVPPQTWQAGYRKHAQKGGRATARRTGRV